MAGDVGDMVESTIPEMTAAARHIRKHADAFEDKFGGILSGGSLPSWVTHDGAMDDLPNFLDSADNAGPSPYYWGELQFLSSSVRLQIGGVGGGGVIGFFATSAQGIRSYGVFAENVAAQYKSREIDSEKELLAADKVLAAQLGIKIEQYGDYVGVDVKAADDPRKPTPTQGEDPGVTPWDELTFEQAHWIIGSADWQSLFSVAWRLQELSGELDAAKGRFWTDVGGLADVGGDGPIWKGAASKGFATVAERTWEALNAWVKPLDDRGTELMKATSAIFQAQDEANRISTQLAEDVSQQHLIIDGMRFAAGALWSWWNSMDIVDQVDNEGRYNVQKTMIEQKANAAAAEITRLRKEALDKIRELGRETSKVVHAAGPWTMPGQYSGLLLADAASPNLPTGPGTGAPKLGGGGGGGGATPAPSVPGATKPPTTKPPTTKPPTTKPPTTKPPTTKPPTTTPPTVPPGTSPTTPGNGAQPTTPDTQPPTIPTTPTPGGGTTPPTVPGTGTGPGGSGTPGTGAGSAPVVTPPVIPGTGTGTGGGSGSGSGSGSGPVVTPPVIPGTGTGTGGGSGSGSGNGSGPVVTPPVIPGTGTGGGAGAGAGGGGGSGGGGAGVPILPGTGGGSLPGGGSSWGGQPWTPDPITPGVSLDGRNALGAGGAGGIGGAGGGPFSDTPVTPIRPGLEGGVTTSAIGGGGGGDLGAGSTPFLPPMMPPMGGAGGGGGGGGQPRTVRRGGPRLVDGDDHHGPAPLSGRAKERKRDRPRVVSVESDSWLSTVEPSATPEPEATPGTAAEPGRAGTHAQNTERERGSHSW
ncbi:MAG: hypothetical protein HOV79_05910 [Hamadaea sp.]|nr:hypothetical protein [Hamadaea sp.]